MKDTDASTGSFSDDDSQRLLAELSLCQQALDTLSSRSWQSTGIILAGAMATLALMLQIQATDLASAVISTVFGMGVLFVLLVWRRFVEREMRIQRRLIRRMRQVEGQLGFLRQSVLQGSTEDLEEELGKAARFVNRILSPVDQGSVLATTTQVVALGWVVVVAWRWFIWAGALD